MIIQIFPDEGVKVVYGDDREPVVFWSATWMSVHEMDGAVIQFPDIPSLSLRRDQYELIKVIKAEEGKDVNKRERRKSLRHKKKRMGRRDEQRAPK